MSRKIRFIAITLAFSALIAASAQAAPTRTPPKEPNLALGRLLHTGEGLFSRLREMLVKLTFESTSQLDPNGNH